MKDDIFYARRRRLLRSHIPPGEVLSGAALLVVLSALVFWVAAQRERYDPAERDVSAELLLAASGAQQLYERPLKRWAEPGAAEDAPGRAPKLVTLEPYPPAVLADGWRPAAAPRHFDADNLYEKINGEAPKFLKQGFRALHFLRLQAPQGDAELAVELFDQNDVGGSLGVFSEHLSPDKIVESRDGVSFFRTSIGAIGRAGRYFFRIAGDAANDTVTDKAVRIALALGALSGSSSPSPPAEDPTTSAATPTPSAANTEPAGLRALRSLGLAPESIAFERENVFQYDFASDFWFGRLDGDARLFYHRAASTPQAERLYAQLLEEQSYEYALVEEDERRALLRHEFLDNFFALQRRGPLLFGVENAADRTAAEAALARFDTLAEDRFK